MPQFDEPEKNSQISDIASSLEGRLLFAVPKKGRLLQPTLDLLEGADIQFRREKRLDIALVKNLPIALIFLPSADIPTFVSEGRISIGITGRDNVVECESSVERHKRKLIDPGKTRSKAPGKHSGCQEILSLGFGACKLQVQVPKDGVHSSPPSLIGKNIGTSFVNLTKDYFTKLEAATSGDKFDGSLKTNVIELSGSVEAACALGVADGIVDLVESGETMRVAGLKPIDTIVESEAILIQNKSPSDPKMVDLILSRLRGIITAQKYVLCQFNVARENLETTVKIAPGKRAATVNALEEENWVAVSSMVERKSIATVMDELSLAGATDVLVLDIKNSRTT